VLWGKCLPGNTVHPNLLPSCAHGPHAGIQPHHGTQPRCLVPTPHHYACAALRARCCTATLARFLLGLNANENHYHRGCAWARCKWESFSSS